MPVTPIVINNLSDLQAIQNNPSGSYVLGANIDAAGLLNFGIVNFTGVLDGQGHSIDNLLNPLFVKIDAQGLVQNLNLTNVHLYDAALAIDNEGTILKCSVSGAVLGHGSLSGDAAGMVIINGSTGIISNSYTTCSVNGNYNTPVVAGLVAENYGAISGSYTTGAVDGSNGAAGGVVGADHGGTVSNSYATGSVTGNAAGGLMGTLFGGNITDSYATGLITLKTGSGFVPGGLVGFSFGGTGGTGGTVTNSYWDIETTGTSHSDGGTGLTTAQLQSGALPNGFDPTIWLDATGQFPELLWQVTSPPTNHPPVASGIAANANEDTNILPVTLAALFTDADLNDTFIFSTDTTGTVGKVTNNNDGTFKYDPNGQFESLGVGETATDTFKYTVTDNHGASTTATATVTIHGENDAPVASPDVAGVLKGGTVTGNVRTNDQDPDIHDILQVSAVNGSVTLVGKAIKGTYGTLTLIADGSYTYVAKNNAQLGAQDIFQYTVSDGHGGTSTSTLTVGISFPALVINAAQLTGSVDEKQLVTGKSAADTASGAITFNVPDAANRPTTSLDLAHQTVTYQDTSGHSYALTSAQIAAFMQGKPSGRIA